MKMNGHTHIDILKIDIEGWEFSTLNTLLASYKASGVPLPFSQLQIEIHAWDMKFSTFLSWWQALEQMGLRPFWTEPNEVYSNYNRGHPPALAEVLVITFVQGHATDDRLCSTLSLMSWVIMNFLPTTSLAFRVYTQSNILWTRIHIISGSSFGSSKSYGQLGPSFESAQ